MFVYWQLIWAFLKIACLTIGGGYAMLPLIQNEVEYQGWLTHTQFLDILAIAEMTPGPLAINAATFVGYRVAGITGAALATVAVALPSMLGMILLAAGWQRYHRHLLMVSVLQVLRPVIAGLIAGASLKLTWALWQAAAGQGNALMDISLALAACLAIRFSRIHPVAVLIAGGIAGLLIKS